MREYNMHLYIRTLEEISSGYVPSRILSFDIVHIFKALQLIEARGRISRELLCEELNLGEGSIKTLVKHFKMENMIETSNAGTKLSNKGKRFFDALISSIPAECKVPRCSIALGKYNYAILLKQLRFAIKSGIEQRDAAIKMGGMGATTLLFRKGKFTMPTLNYDCLKKEPHVHRLLIENLNPEDDDVIIIGSDDKSGRVAELAAKSAALLTIRNHEKHNYVIFPPPLSPTNQPEEIGVEGVIAKSLEFLLFFRILFILKQERQEIRKT
ncbi:MAG: DUF4443 domain-containing protein [Nitrososphaeraceae archaeon]